MPLPKVTGVAWWEMQLSHYKAVFRRGRTAGYTKDLLQAPRAIEDVFRQLFTGDPPYEPITYRWPGGSYADGKIYPVSDRLEVGQWTAAGAPGPWRIGDPASDPLITLPGDPNASIPNEADTQWESLEELEPWLVMVQLENDQYELHLRAYLGAPPPELLDAAFERIPAELRREMQGRGGLAAEHGLPDLWFDPADLRDPWKTSPEAAAAEAEAALSPEEVGGALGSEYSPANESVTSTAPEPFEIDPDARDRGSQAHAITQNALSEAVRRRGHEPRSPRSGEPQYDLAWAEDEKTTVVVEVKSVTQRNSERQLRLALGQVLRYRHLLEGSSRTVRSGIALSGRPRDDRWVELCQEHDVGLIWMSDLDQMLKDWLD